MAIADAGSNNTQAASSDKWKNEILDIPRAPRRSGKVTAPQRDKRRSIVEDETGWSKPLLWRLCALVVVIAIFLLPRLTELDRLLTPDEPIWLARSANFYEALSSGDLGSTYQFAHPGVTVMWLGAAGYFWKANGYVDRIDGQVPQRLNRIGGILENLGYVPLDVLVAGRTMLVLGMVVVFATSFLYGLRLFSFPVALLGFLLISLDPFMVAHSRLLHVDAPSAMFMLLSVVSGSVYFFRGQKRIDLLVSGIAAGLAVLTRSQMGVLAIWFVMMLLLDARGWNLYRGGWIATPRTCFRPTLAWGCAAFLTCLLFWPALWVDPVRVVQGIFSFAETAAIEGHERTIVFAGRLYEGDPGLKFYPATFLWRATPPVLVGVILALVAVIWSRRLSVSETQRRIAFSLMLAAGSYGLLMSAAAKKFDRYLLPVYPLAAFLAAWGLLLVAKRLSKRLPSVPQWSPAAVVATLALAIHLSGIGATAPYYLSYYNPMLGGASAAPDSMMVGWGEGLDQVGAFVNDLPDGSTVVVSAESWPSTLSYFLEGDARIAAFIDDPSGAFRFARSDFYVLYTTPLERRDVWQPWLDTLEQKEPVLTVTLNGLEYARLYDIRDDPLPEYMLTGRTGIVLWNDVARMVATTGADHIRAAYPGTTLEETLYFDQLRTHDLGSIAGRFAIRLMLIGPAGEIASERVASLTLETPVRHGLFTFEQELDIPPDAALGEYTLEMQLIDNESGQPVQGFSFRYGERLAATVVLDTVQIVPNAEEADSLGGEER